MVRGTFSKGPVIFYDNGVHRKVYTMQHFFRILDGKSDIFQREKSPDIAPCEIRAFAELKENLGGHRFAKDEKIKQLLQTDSMIEDWISISRTLNNWCNVSKSICNDLMVA